ncbi:MAG TPA: ribosomal protein S18-alanine N-acetyltransferase [Blastocatellia bacterium]
MSVSESMREGLPPFYKGYAIEDMLLDDLGDVVELEEITGLNRWGYDAYKRELLKNPNSVMLVARSLQPGQRALGFLAGWIVEDELHINNIASHPTYRRLGIGRALLEEAVLAGRRRGAAFILLEVRASNEAAQQLYRKLGFVIIGRRRDYYRAPTEDALVMKLEF